MAGGLVRSPFWTYANSFFQVAFILLFLSPIVINCSDIAAFPWETLCRE